MATRVLGTQAIGVVLVIQERDGSMHIIGSKNVTSSMVEMNQDIYAIEPGVPMLGLRSFRIEAECADLTWQYRAQSIAAPMIEQRGIYLPDMSFKALP
jgi:hypothetical protein